MKLSEEGCSVQLVYLLEDYYLLIPELPHPNNNIATD